MNQIVNSTPLQQKPPPMQENATIAEFTKFKAASENYKALRGFEPLPNIISIPAENYLCVLYEETLTDFLL